MSADESGPDLLRRAAAEMRQDWGTEHEVYKRVADWLDAEAVAMDAMAMFTRAMAEVQEEVTISGAALTVLKHPDGQIDFRADTSAPAVAVAATYLGTAQKVATDARSRPGATDSPEVAGSQAAPVDADEAPDSLGVQDGAGLGEVGA